MIADEQIGFSGPVPTNLAHFKNLDGIELTSVTPGVSPVAGKAVIQNINGELKVVLPTGVKPFMDANGVINTNAPAALSEIENLYASLLESHDYSNVKGTEFLEATGNGLINTGGVTTATYNASTKSYDFTNAQELRTLNLISNPETRFMVYGQITGSISIYYSTNNGTSWSTAISNGVPIAPLPTTSDFILKFVASGSCNLKSFGLFKGYVANPSAVGGLGGASSAADINSILLSPSFLSGRISGVSTIQQALALINSFDFPATAHNQVGTTVTVSPILPGDFPGNLNGKAVSNTQKLAEAVDGLILGNLPVVRLAQATAAGPTIALQKNKKNIATIQRSNSGAMTFALPDVGTCNDGDEIEFLLPTLIDNYSGIEISAYFNATGTMGYVQCNNMVSPQHSTGAELFNQNFALNKYEPNNSLSCKLMTSLDGSRIVKVCKIHFILDKVSVVNKYIWTVTDLVIN